MNGTRTSRGGRAARALGVAAVALLLAAGPARAQDKLQGQIAPELGAFEQIQGEKFVDLKSLRGRVVLLEFFATW